MSPKAYVCVGIVCLAFSACYGGTDQENAEAGDKPSVYVGIGALISSKPYIGVDAQTYALPVFGYEGKRLFMRGLAGGYRVYSDKGFSIGPVVQPRFEGYEEDDSSALAGMDDRDWSVDAGVGTFLQTDIGLLGLSYVTDILSLHDGQELEFSYTIRFPLAGFDIIPSAGIRWKSQNLVDYYYGVEPDEAIVPGRPAYETGSAADPYLGLAVRRKLGGRWSLLTAVQYEWLDDEISDSPIVDDDYDASFLVGVLYSW